MSWFFCILRPEPSIARNTSWSSSGSRPRKSRSRRELRGEAPSYSQSGRADSMSNKTRYFVVTASVILAVGLTPGLLASYMGLPAAFAQAAGPDELQCVPADSAVVAYANVREVMDSTFCERFRPF